MKFGVRFIVSLLILVSSCKSPERLVEKAMRKDPKVLEGFIDTAYIVERGDTIIKLLPRPPKPTVIGKLIEFSKERQENRLADREDRRESRTDRVRLRQEGRTDRSENRNDRKEKVRESKDNRSITNTFNRANKRLGIVDSRNKRREANTKARQDGRTDRRWARVFMFSLIAFLIGVATGFIIKNKLDNNGKNT